MRCLNSSRRSSSSDTRPSAPATRNDPAFDDAISEDGRVRAVLLTGAAGRVGRAATPRLEEEGWDVRPFDLPTGGDLRDEAAVFDAAEGCDAIVHAGAIAHDDGGTPAEIVATNVLGTWHVLLAAE